MSKDILLKTVRRLIEDGKQVVATQFDAGDPGISYAGGRPIGVELQPFAKWAAGCVNLIRMLGEAGQQWKDQFDDKFNWAETAIRMLGTLEAIEDAIKDGLLVKVEDLVLADAFDSLLDQADYLNAEGYFLAAGVLGRAILEEHLRSWCQHAGCNPTKSKPTLNNFKDELYKAKHFNTSVMKHVDSMAAVGNDAAHNKPTLAADDVTRLLRDVRDFLAKHSYASP